MDIQAKPENLHLKIFKGTIGKKEILLPLILLNSGDSDWNFKG